MTEEIGDHRVLAERLKGRMRPHEALLIGIDGFVSAGKTQLAYCLACGLEGLGTYVIDIDQFLLARGLPFIDKLDYARLRELIRLYRVVPIPILVSGVEILDVLERAGTRPDVLVYVKHINSMGIWIDADQCASGRSSSASSTDGYPAPITLGEEIERYHARFRPLDTADFIYRRIDG